MNKTFDVIEFWWLALIFCKNDFSCYYDYTFSIKVHQTNEEQ